MFKIAFIGAGSVGFTRGILTDLLSVKEFHNIEVAFTDINPKNLDMVTQLCQRDIDSNGLDIKILSTTDRKEAFKDAKYIVNCVRIGGLEAFETDVDIPLKYGVDQCVGDTLCAGGIMYGQRSAYAALEFCKDIKEVAAPDCLLLNYANPNAMVTWACIKYGKVNTIGLCHGVQGGHAQIAEVLEQDIKDVDIICTGINHQTWYTSIKVKGVPVTKDELLTAFEKHPTFRKTEKVRIDILRHFGYYSTESNGHLSEYLPWYRKRPDEIKDWIDTSSWINGETGGYLRVCKEGRNWFDTDFPNWMKEEPKNYNGDDRGKEHASYIIEGLETGRQYRGHFNIVNNGCIDNLPDDAIIETPCYVDYNGISVAKVGNLPLGCAAICNQSIEVQRMSVEALVSGDDYLLKQAMMMDPLVGACCNTAEVVQMTEEMLIAGEEWLPQYKDAIEKAKERRDSGEWFPVEEYEGAVRLKVKTVEEMAEDKEKARKLASASEKGGM